MWWFRKATRRTVVERAAGSKQAATNCVPGGISRARAGLDWPDRGAGSSRVGDANVTPVDGGITGLSARPRDDRLRSFRPITTIPS
jgi:hypothetical protein